MFTIHHDQKPTDDERYWKRYIEEEDADVKEDIRLHIENLRVLFMLRLRELG